MRSCQICQIMLYWQICQVNVMLNWKDTSCQLITHPVAVLTSLQQECNMLHMRSCQICQIMLNWQICQVTVMLDWQDLRRGDTCQLISHTGAVLTSLQNEYNIYLQGKLLDLSDNALLVDLLGNRNARLVGSVRICQVMFNWKDLRRGNTCQLVSHSLVILTSLQKE